MKPLITRWKTEPPSNGPGLAPPALGWVYDFSPVARPTKFATVFGAWSGNRLILMSPSDVRSVAVGFAFGAVTTPIVPAPAPRRPGGRSATSWNGGPGCQ